jgi:LysM repeat protein
MGVSIFAGGGGSRGVYATVRIAALAVGLALMGACAGIHQAPTGPPAAPDGSASGIGDRENLEGGVVHVVEPGQTLWRIARVYDVPLEDLARANDILDPTRLEVGRGLWVPGAAEIRVVVPHMPGSTEQTPAAAGATAFVWPLSGGRVLSRFGEPRRTHRHKGLDVGGSHGQRVVATASGRVIYSDDRMRGYGNTVILDHGGGVQSLYAHNSKLLVRVGDQVARGEPIAVMGRSGNATGEHCHFEIRRNRVPVDPMAYLSGGPR